MSDDKTIDTILHCQKKIKKEGVSEDKLLHYLGRLAKLQITVQTLAETGIGRTVNALSRNEGSVGQAADTLVRIWKRMVEQQQSKPDSEQEDASQSDSSSSESESDPDEPVEEEEEDLGDVEEELEIPNDRSDNERTSSSHHRHSSKSKSRSSSEKHEDYNQGDHDNSSRKTTSLSSSSKRSKLEKSQNYETSSNDDGPPTTSTSYATPVSKNYDATTSSTSNMCKKHRSDRSNNSEKKSKSPKKAETDSTSGVSFGDVMGSLDRHSSSSRKHDKELESKKKRQTEPVLKPVVYTSQVNFLVDGDGTDKSENHAIDTMLSNRNRNSRSKVYSGVKSGRRGMVPTLFDLSMQVVKENIAYIEDTREISYDILKPALERATPQKLIELEDLNEYLIGETDELWQFHCRRDFRGECPDETESWRQLYERCKEGQQQKFEQIRKKMKRQLETAVPVRKAKLAYVETSNGPRFSQEKAQTIKNGMKTLKMMEEKGAKRGVSSSASVGFNNPKVSGDPKKVVLEEASVIISPGSRAGHAPAPSVSRERESVAKLKPRKAPLMQKTMKLIRSLNRR